MESPHQVGHFEVLERLGAGGMGEVYKARDTRLNRFVAIKFLPEAASADARERFQREALAIAAISHPHICTLYEAGEQDGRPYLVMELLEGESLRARLSRGPVPTPQLLDWSAQIADALDAAHKRGVLHRDLKPDNIWLLPGGHVKVLDFGLARLEAAPESTAGGEDRTLTSPGVTLGTVPYMSPEQARGETLDARSDVFSFGSVFYEMASGRAAFPPRSAAETIAAVLKDQPPPLRRARPDLPPKVEEIAGRCLEKDPDLRYQSAADLRSELRRLSRLGASQAAGEEPAAAASSAALPAAALSDSQVMSGLLRRHWRWPALAAALVVLAALAWWRLGPKSAPALAHLQFHQLTFSGNVEDAVISPDGKFLAHVDNGPQGTSLHLLSTVSGSDVEIMPPAPGCCQSPSFSPDGGQVYFLDNRQLKAVPVLGGAVRTIADPACSGAGFSPDGSRIAYLNTFAPVTRVMVAQADGSQPRPLNQAPAGGGYGSQCWVNAINAPTHSPTWSPDGHWIAVAFGPVSGAGHIELVDARSGEAHPIGPAVFPTAADINWLPDGRALLLTASIPDSAAPQVWEMSVPGGKLTQLTDDLQGYSASSLSQQLQLAVVHASPQASVWVGRPGGEFQQVPGGGPNQDGAAGLTWTPQGALVSVRNLGGKQQIGEQNPDGSQTHVLAAAGLPPFIYLLHAAAAGPIVIGSAGEAATIWRMNADGSGLAELGHPPANVSLYGPAPVLGGSAVVYMRTGADGNQTLWTIPLTGGAPRQVWNGFVYAGCCVPSPDGTRVFGFSRMENGAHMGTIVRLDGKPPLTTFLPAFDRSSMAGPLDWTPDGKAITFIHRQGTVDNVWAQPIAGGAPYALTHFTELRIAGYAFSRDGRLAVSRGSQNSDAVLATGLGAGGH